MNRSAQRIGNIVDGKYELVRRLGSGSFGEVYEAKHRIIGHQVALKLLWPQLAEDDAVVARFQKEACAAGNLKHENVIRVDDVGVTAEGEHYLRMEYCEGRDCASFLESSETISPARAIEIALQVCSGLTAAHAQGIVHRDLKPANLLLTSRADGSELVKILDFGVAKLLSGSRSYARTRTGLQLGTPIYMPPESIHGAEVDARSDIYALGVILYEMLSGQPPYHDAPSTAALLLQISDLERTPPPLVSRGPGLPRGLHAVVARAMAKRPEQRFASAAEFAAALRACGAATAVDDRSAEGSMPSPGVARPDPAEIPKLRRLKLILVGLGACGALLLAGSLSTAPWAWLGCTAGISQACFELGSAYADRRSGAWDPAAARGAFQRAAEAGHLAAQNQLGLLLEHASAPLQDKPTAVAWFRRAALGDYVEAEFNLGRVYESGAGIAVDLREAMRWYATAAQRGHAEARARLARLQSSEEIAALPSGIDPQLSAAAAVKPRAPVAATANNETPPQAPPTTRAAPKMQPAASVVGVTEPKPTPAVAPEVSRESEEPAARGLIVNANGTVTDTRTGLVWQREVPASYVPACSGRITAVVGELCSWHDAQRYCSRLLLAGGGWRLPTIEELKSLVDTTRKRPAIDTTAFPATPAAWFWSSSTRSALTTSAWSVYFLNGISYDFAKDIPFRVRCVR